MIEEIRSRLSSGNVNDIYGALIRAGKEGELELEDIVLKLTSHESPVIRGAAIMVLGFYWRLNKYSEVAWNMFLTDEDEEVRSDALAAYSNIFAFSNDKKIMNSINSILRNKKEPILVRSVAYSAILAISPIETRDWPEEPDFDDFDEEVDWDLIDKLISEAK